MKSGMAKYINLIRAEINKKLKQSFNRTTSAKSHKSIATPKSGSLERKYDYRREKCHFLFSNGLKEAKLYEDSQSGDDAKERFKSANIRNNRKLKEHQKQHITYNINSLISIDENEDNGIVEDIESGSDYFEPKAFDLKSKINVDYLYRKNICN
jgi:hypothetical protein